MFNKDEIQAKAAIIIHINTGDVLLSKNENRQLDMASLTKLMTLSIILEKINNVELQWNEMVEVSLRAENVIGSRILLKAGHSLSVEDLFKAILICSGNDAAITMAEAISGSVEEFADEMNKKATKLKLTNTHYMNPHGLPHKNHYSSVNDLATLSTALLKEEAVLNYSQRQSEKISIQPTRLKKIVNTNTLLKKNPDVDGLKTGYSPSAGHCIAATASSKGNRILVIVLGEPTREIRDREVLAMIDYAFNQLQNRDQ